MLALYQYLSFVCCSFISLRNGALIKEKKKGIVMEIARCDCDGATLYAMLQNYLNALHTQAAPQRMTLTAVKTGNTFI